MTREERIALFWVDDITGQGLKVQRRDGQIETRDGFRFQWVRNELGSLYLKSLGQIGYELRPRITMAEYATQCRAMAEAHAASLAPGIRGAIGYEVAMASMCEMNPCLPFDDGPAGGACFL